VLASDIVKDDEDIASEFVFHPVFLLELLGGRPPF